MAILRMIWKMLRGVGLLVLLIGLFTTVFITSCVASLFTGTAPGRPGRLRFGA